jgi:8-oxo-dGTP diphosphatase
MSGTNDTVETISLTTDIIAFRGDEVLLIERGWEPFKGCLALPGGYVDLGETSRAAAAREAAEETHLDLDPDRLYQVGVYDAPNRDPRGRVVSIAYAVIVPLGTTVKAGDDAASAEWVDIEDAFTRPMAFDHKDILAAAYSALLDGELEHHDD